MLNGNAVNILNHVSGHETLNLTQMPLIVTYYTSNDSREAPNIHLNESELADKRPLGKGGRIAPGSSVLSCAIYSTFYLWSAKQTVSVGAPLRGCSSLVTWALPGTPPPAQYRPSISVLLAEGWMEAN